MPNSRKLSIMRPASASSNPLANSIAKRPLAPLQSRCHKAWEGLPGKAGQRTRAISERPSRKSATRKALRACCAMRKGSVHMPHSTK